MAKGRSGVTLIELLVSLVITILIVGFIYSFYIKFYDQAAKERKKAEILKEVKSTFRLFEDDIRHASFGFPKSSPCRSKGICLFFIHDNCNAGDENFCKSGTDRFFVADGWTIIKDFTIDGSTDGKITNSNYEELANNKFFAKVQTYNAGSKKITIDKLNIDNRKANDIKDNKAIIICGRENNSGKVGQEGRRIGKIRGQTIYFLNEEEPLSYKKNCSSGHKGIVIPANVWYVRKGKDGEYWLYRNEKKVLPGVEDFQVHVGYDFDDSGVIEQNEWINTPALPDNAEPEKLKFFWFEIKVAYKWKGKKYQINYTTRIEALH